MQTDFVPATFKLFRLLLAVTLWSCHAWVAHAFRLIRGLAAAVFRLLGSRKDRRRIALVISQAKAPNILSLRGVKRRSNLMKKEIATPSGLAMTCQESRAACSHYSDLFDSRPADTRIASIPKIWDQEPKQSMAQSKAPNSMLRTPNFRGFTLIELIVVIIIIGILAATVLPKVNFGTTSSTVSVAGASNMVRSDIRYAQEWAIANRTSKQIQFTQNSATYSFAPAVNFDPTGRLPSGVTTTTTITFTFNSLGEPSTSSAGVWTVSVSDGVTTIPITITQYTGEVAY